MISLLDFRIDTFLTLCEEKSYTKTAQRLKITQPAVSQHIRYLEEYFGLKLFQYQGKSLTLTLEGEKLRNFALRSKADWYSLEQKLKKQEKTQHLSFGATLTIGEYVMPDILKYLIENMPNTSFSMLVDNTETLLQKLKHGRISFAFVEGHFDKDKFTTELISNARFIAVCSPKHSFAKRQVSFDEIFTQRLIVREPGSGTRNILEQALLEHNQSIESFIDIIEIGSLGVIKALVGQGLGITFLYENAVERELLEGTLEKINLAEFDVVREFNFVCLKDSYFIPEYLEFSTLVRNIANKGQPNDIDLC